MPAKKAEPQNEYSVFWVLFSFRGRINREEYWLAHLFLLMANFSYFMWLFGEELAQETQISADFLYENAQEFGFIFLLNLLCSIALAVKRLHDLGWPGFLVLFYIFLGFVGGIITILLGVLPGERGANRYGPEPPRK